MRFERNELNELNKTDGGCDRIVLITIFLEKFLKKNKLHLAETTGKVYLVDDEDEDSYVRLDNVEVF